MSRLHLIVFASSLCFLSACPGCPYGPEEAIPLATPKDEQGHSPQYHEAFSKSARREKGPWGKQQLPMGVPLVEMLGKEIATMACSLQPTLGEVKGLVCEFSDAGVRNDDDKKGMEAPCALDQDTLRKEFFKGPSIPPEKIHLVHPYLDDVELAYEGGRLRSILFIANDWIQRKELGLLSIPEVRAPVVRTEKLCRGSHWCVSLEQFSKFDPATCPKVENLSPQEKSLSPQEKSSERAPKALKELPKTP